MHRMIVSQKHAADAVHRNVSIRYHKIKITPPVSLLQTQLTMRVISARSFGSLTKINKTHFQDQQTPQNFGQVRFSLVIELIPVLSSWHSRMRLMGHLRIT